MMAPVFLTGRILVYCVFLDLLVGCGLLPPRFDMKDFTKASSLMVGNEFGKAYDSGWVVESQYKGHWNQHWYPIHFQSIGDTFEIDYQDLGRESRNSGHLEAVTEKFLFMDKSSSRRFTAVLSAVYQLACHNSLMLGSSCWVVGSDDHGGFKATTAEKFVRWSEQDDSLSLTLQEKDSAEDSSRFSYHLSNALKSRSLGYHEITFGSASRSRDTSYLFSHLLFQGAWADSLSISGEGPFNGYEMLRFKRGTAVCALIIPAHPLGAIYQLPWFDYTYRVYFRKDLDAETKKRILMSASLYRHAEELAYSWGDN